MKLMVVDTSVIFRLGLRLALSGTPEMDIVAESDRGASAADLAVQLAPDLVVSDLQLADCSAIELAQELERTVPSARLVILASHGPGVIVHQALAAGVGGYVLKTESPTAVLTAIRRVGCGELVLPPGLSMPSPAPQKGDGQPPIQLLSRRERQIFDLVVWGSSNKQISGRLGISVKTVETHRGHINRKLRLHTTADIVRLASFLGMLEQHPLREQKPGGDGVSRPVAS